ncbi:hypothetical protein [Apilactobacillus timberlakei]|uniref:Uncharacterized protein n=1 Tax=Apilactobacillus timberlakei TaxID=2008380 RepID=A0ABY2YR42_9LACO|nr:hypothetical protein [Apilactobacillus timberlakei]TPR12396.1 hypothetical protein DY048_07545 [Apilactobacillus timberlakei]TPR12982.1 hypothetical protein DY052_08705 [Apilactobacillus timberlakei]
MEDENNTQHVGDGGFTPVNANVARYDKDYLIESGLFNFVDRNILKIALEDGSQYSQDEAREAINKFERGDN